MGEEVSPVLLVLAIGIAITILPTNCEQQQQQERFGFGFIPSGDLPRTGGVHVGGDEFVFPIPFMPPLVFPNPLLNPDHHPQIPPEKERNQGEAAPKQEEQPPKQQEEQPGLGLGLGIPRFPNLPGGVIPLPGGMIPLPGSGGGEKNNPGEEISAALGGLRADFYKEKCPSAEAIVKRVLQQALEKDPRAAPSLLRLHFHDCFVQGCDASVLLDDVPGFIGEKTANPNLNSARGFEVIDAMKAAVEKECEGVVSCADILALAARDSVVLTGGPAWEVPLGRRDSLIASRSIANRDIPAPNSTLPQLVAAFANKGLSLLDLVALSGSHTIGFARCATFSQRLYNFQRTRRPDPSIHPPLLAKLQQICPRRSSSARKEEGFLPAESSMITSVLDVESPQQFDNRYFLGLQLQQGILQSDQVLFAAQNPEAAATTNALVVAFSKNQDAFFKAFAASMIKMSSIKPLLGSHGQIRRHCRFVNH